METYLYKYMYNYIYYTIYAYMPISSHILTIFAIASDMKIHKKKLKKIISH